MKWIQLYRDGQEILASDGVMQVSSKTLTGMKEEVIARNVVGGEKGEAIDKYKN
jgi:hypothetical protein